jgi:hypothetical protein
MPEELNSVVKSLDNIKLLGYILSIADIIEVYSYY